MRLLLHFQSGPRLECSWEAAKRVWPRCDESSSEGVFNNKYSGRKRDILDKPLIIFSLRDQDRKQLNLVSATVSSFLFPLLFSHIFFMSLALWYPIRVWIRCLPKVFALSAAIVLCTPSLQTACWTETGSCGDNAFYAIVGGFVGTPLLSIYFWTRARAVFFSSSSFCNNFYKRSEGVCFVITSRSFLQFYDPLILAQGFLGQVIKPATS